MGSSLNRPWLKLAVSAGLLLTALILTDLSAVKQHLRAVAGRSGELKTIAWLVLAALATIPQYLLSARRWQLTAKQLGLSLPYLTALRAYYKATFFNQLLPGGVLGDVGRALEHGRAQSAELRFSAYRAVAIERLAGQLVLLIAVIIAVLPSGILDNFILASESTHSSVTSSPMIFVVVVTTILLTIFFSTRFNAVVHARAGVRVFLSDLASTWLTPALMVRQILLSLTILCSYLTSYIALALALGYVGDLLWLSTAILLVLLSMSLPVTIAGWGIREISAAGLWMVGGLDPAQGLAIAVAYGLLNLVCSLPGLWFTVKQQALSG